MTPQTSPTVDHGSISLDRSLGVAYAPLRVTKGEQGGILQTGSAEAAEGHVVFAVGDHYSLAINHDGLTRGHEIELDGGDGMVRVAGTLDASSDAVGGRVVVTGDRVGLFDARVDASGDTGGGEIRAKSSLVLAGIEAARRTFHALDPDLGFQAAVEDGARLEPGDRVAAIEGALGAILAGERTALNFLQRLSGVATLTARFVDAVRGTRARILDTRKTAPGWRQRFPWALVRSIWEHALLLQGRRKFQNDIKMKLSVPCQKIS